MHHFGKKADVFSSSLPNMPIGGWEQVYASAQRPPPFIIGVAGGTASGKTSVCDIIISSLKDHRVSLISQDSFYRPLTEEEKERANDADYNFDHPDAFDWDLLHQTIEALRNQNKMGKPIGIPVYDFVTHSRLEETRVIYGADVIIMEGILAFYPADLRELFDLKIFVDADADTRLARRVVRDINHRGRDVMGVIRQYEKFVKPAFDEYINPTKKYADVIIPRGADNLVAVELIVGHIKSELAKRESSKGNGKLHVAGH